MLVKQHDTQTHATRLPCGLSRAPLLNGCSRVDCSPYVKHEQHTVRACVDANLCLQRVNVSSNSDHYYIVFESTMKCADAPRVFNRFCCLLSRGPIFQIRWAGLFPTTICPILFAVCRHMKRATRESAWSCVCCSCTYLIHFSMSPVQQPLQCSWAIGGMRDVSSRYGMFDRLVDGMFVLFGGDL
jgi:hypothetical protein